MKGYHKCPHCDEWHDCNRPKRGCRAAPIVLLLFILLFPPLMMLMIEYWGGVTCKIWPNWSKGCQRLILFNDDIDKRLQKIEEKR